MEWEKNTKNTFRNANFSSIFWSFYSFLMFKLAITSLKRKMMNSGLHLRAADGLTHLCYQSILNCVIIVIIFIMHLVCKSTASKTILIVSIVVGLCCNWLSIYIYSCWSRRCFQIKRQKGIH